MNSLVAALRGVTANKLRAALTALGIVIGVASVVAMLALGNGARAAVEANFRALGSDNIEISPRYEFKNDQFAEVGRTLSYRDGLALLEAAPEVRNVDMEVRGAAKVRRGRTVLDMTITGAMAGALALLGSKQKVQPINWPEDAPVTPDAFIARGRFLTPAEVGGESAVCVLGHKTALDLFEGDDPLGESVLVSRRKCLVIGVLAELEMIDPRERTRNRPNDSLYLPISLAVNQLYEKEPSVVMVARVRDESRIDIARRQIAGHLRQRHAIERDANGNWKDDFTLTTRSDVLGARQAAARTFSLLLAGMATVSLVVGGIGIMNVMLVSVTERTREIGVRMAVGARPGDIVAQFLIEATLISVGGGAVGLLLGVLSIPLAATVNGGAALLAPESVPLALVVAMGVGVLFGIYPALRASRLDPIEALRYE
jgi:putative ABC transport system permease protein